MSGEKKTVTMSTFTKINLHGSHPIYLRGQRAKGRIYYPNLKMDVHGAAIAGDLSALRDAIKRGEDVNSVHVKVSWFVGM